MTVHRQCENGDANNNNGAMMVHDGQFVIV